MTSNTISAWKKELDASSDTDLKEAFYALSEEDQERIYQAAASLSVHAQNLGPISALEVLFQLGLWMRYLDPKNTTSFLIANRLGKSRPSATVMIDVTKRGSPGKTKVTVSDVL